MGKSRSNRAKRAPSRPPKGLPVKGNTSFNPFEQGPQKKPKHAVHNRGNYSTLSSSSVRRPTALALALKQRQEQVQAARKASQKSNVFQDRRLTAATPEEQALQRLVKERHRVSRRVTKYQLDDDRDKDDGDDGPAMLTHKGKALSDLTAADHVILSDTEEDYGDLEKLDTDLHFGGGGFGARSDPYGPAGASNPSLSQVYAQRKTDLDDLILRRKILKAEKQQTKGEQVESFEKMDESYTDVLAPLLQFRDKRKAEKVDPEDEIAEWNREMKMLQLNRKVAATDRTKTAEEVAAEEAKKLHELETKRLARMNGDFEEDDLSDVSVEPKTKSSSRNHPEALDGDSDGDSDDMPEHKVKFTADGLVKVDKQGNIVREPEKPQSSPVVYSVGTRVRANYHANEQMDGYSAWYEGVVSRVHHVDGDVSYDIDYDDGDFEEGVEPQHVQPVDDVSSRNESKPKPEEQEMNLKRQKAKEMARSSIPYVFEVPTTLDALHELIAKYAKTGDDASLIIRRIHTANSVKLDRRNTEKMQNFYDVLLRRFIAVGDAIYFSGGGGVELCRFKQLDALTQVMYKMAQDNSEIAAAVWSRRLGFLQSAHAKRVRDSELESDEEEPPSAWPSTGVVLMLRALAHIFPVTDQRHPIVTPAMLLLGQMVSHTPIQSIYDLAIGLICAGLLIEFNKEAKRVAPEALAFLAGTIRLFAADDSQRDAELFLLPALGVAASETPFSSLRAQVSSAKAGELPKLSLFRDHMQSDSNSLAILSAALDMVSAAANGLSPSSLECLVGIESALRSLEPGHEEHPIPKCLHVKITAATEAVDRHRQSARSPLRRRAAPAVASIKSLAPRLECAVSAKKRSRDGTGHGDQGVATALRHELQREHKAARRELQWDATLTEQARRLDQAKRDQAAASKRHKAFAWLEQQQGEMNQQVRQGGGLLQGGGIGAARAKARSGKIGVKKGGKL